MHWEILSLYAKQIDHSGMQKILTYSLSGHPVSNWNHCVVNSNFCKLTTVSPAAKWTTVCVNSRNNLTTGIFILWAAKDEITRLDTHPVLVHVHYTNYQSPFYVNLHYSKAGKTHSVKAL